MDAAKFSLLLILQFSVCSSIDTITVNQSLKEGDFLISKKNIFVLGFFSPGKSHYRYLGIWYKKIPQKTVVWVANRNNPINGSAAVLTISQYGNLILYGNQDQKVSVWSTNVSVEVTDTCAVQLLESGNLVLVHGRSKKIVWQSFDNPTNTMIEGMKLGVNRRTGLDQFLKSWRSADDPGTGDYNFRLNPNGSPQLFLYKGSNHYIYWRSSPWPWRSMYVYNYSFINNKDDIYFSYSLYDASVIIIVVLDHYGSVKVLNWNEIENQWKEFDSVPKYRCDLYGQCGAYSMCDPTNVNRFECTCLPGYEPRSPKDWYLRDGSGGCIKKRRKSSSVCGHGDGFVKVANVLVPDASRATLVDMSMGHTDCEDECKRSCSCSAYASIEIPGKRRGCLAWHGELIDTIYERNEKYDLYVRVDALELADIARKSKGSLEMMERLAILIPSVTLMWIVIAIFACLWLRKSKRKGTAMNKWHKRLIEPIGGSNYFEEILAANESPPDLLFFNLSTIISATDNFSAARKLGQGGFGSVYKGRLANGQEIAVKRLSKSSGQGIEEFRSEVILTAKLQHRNLVKLLGYCIQGEEQLLIYEYLPNKSLDPFLFDQTRPVLDWRKRFDIIVGIARGILYLHQDSRLRIIHRDLKCSNILLDAKMNPKISDFGMARLFKGDQMQDKTNKVVGTYGYMSPEYAVLGKYSIKSDVFSFGVILLEIVSGKKNNSFYPADPSLTLIGHVWELWREGRALEIVDSSMKESYHSYEAMRCIQIGLLCVQEDAMDRPTMLAVVLMLNSETALPIPKQPAFTFRESCNNPKSIAEEEVLCSVNEMTISGVLTR